MPAGELYELMRKADEALYHAKRLGRDQVQVFTPREPAALSAQLASA